jgi:hypothetical protein
VWNSTTWGKLKTIRSSLSWESPHSTQTRQPHPSNKRGPSTTLASFARPRLCMILNERWPVIVRGFAAQPWLYFITNPSWAEEESSKGDDGDAEGWLTVKFILIVNILVPFIHIHWEEKTRLNGERSMNWGGESDSSSGRRCSPLGDQPPHCSFWAYDFPLETSSFSLPSMAYI